MWQGKADRPTVDEPSGNKVIEPKYIGAGFMQCGKLMDTILWVPLLLDAVYTDFQMFECEIIKDSNRCLIGNYYYKRQCCYKAAKLVETIINNLLIFLSLVLLPVSSWLMAALL
jgi:hypothetical protein